MLITLFYKPCKKYGDSLHVNVDGTSDYITKDDFYGVQIILSFRTLKEEIFADKNIRNSAKPRDKHFTDIIFHGWRVCG